MRIETLTLERYGPFTDRRLDFRIGLPLTVVHGPNEAGKTCALNGIEDALYGIEHKSRMAFEHGYGEMRVGAVLSASDGRRIAFSRRKASKRTLVDPAGEPLADDALAAFLGRIGRDLFRQAFGLNSTRLRLGAQALTAGEGSLGEALLAAAPGLGHLADLRRRLGEDADALFTERRSATRPYYRAWDAWDEARRRSQEATLGIDRVRAAEAALARASEDHATAVSRRRGRIEADSAAARMLSILPRLGAIDHLAARLAELEPLAGVDRAFEDDLDAALLAARDADRDLAAIADARPRLLAERAAIAPSEATLAEAVAIEAVAAAVAKRLTDGDELAAARERHAIAEARLAALAARLDLADADTLAARRPTTAATGRLQALSIDRARLTAERTAAAAALADADRRLAESMAALERAGAPSDPRDARARFSTVAGLPDAERRARASREDLAALARRLRDGLVAAGLDEADAAALRRRRLPDVTQLRALAGARKDHVRALEAAMQRVRDARDRLSATRHRCRDLTELGPVPDGSAVAAARAIRDEALGQVRDVLFRTPPPAATARAEAMAVLERSIVATDALADLRIAQSERVAVLDAARRAEAEAVDALQVADGIALQAERALQDGAAAFSALLAGTDLAAPDPDAALAALETHGRLLELLDRVDGSASAASEADADVARLQADLSALATDLGVATSVGSGPALLAVVGVRIEALEQAWDTSRRHAAAIAEATRTAADTRAALAALDARLAEGATAWAEALAAVNLPAGFTPAEVDAVLADWAQAAGPLDSRAEAGRAIERLTAEIDRFDRATAELVSRLAPDLATLPTTASARRLHDILRTCEASKRTADDLDTRIAEFTRGERAARERAETANACLAALAHRAGVAVGTDLRTVVDAARERRRLAGRLEEERRLLAELTGESEAVIREHARQVRGEDLEALRAEIARDMPLLDEAVDAATRTHQSALREYDDITRHHGAESARQAEENALAHLVEIADDWRVLSAARRIVTAAVEEFRRRHQSPVLTEAGRLFASMTGGRYPSIVADYGDDGTPVLRVVRDDARRLDVDALSEGTRDQLFLALRLATLLDHAERAEPLPFVGDDLFITFDEQRTAAGLDALALFSERVQTILFTHHEHVATIAMERLGNRVDVLRL
jgi:uncharacterized protein YhaN